MNTSRLTRAMLYGQYALLLLLAYDAARIVGHQLRNGGHYSVGCLGIDFIDTLPSLLFIAAALTGVLGLLAGRRWAPFPYVIAFAVETSVILDVVRPSHFAPDFVTMLILSAYASSALVVVSFFTGASALLRPKAA
jgi:hypothetical protein